MRLWHEALIPHLPRQWLLGQHRECCALRGNGWGRKHSTVDYVFEFHPYKLFQYHMKVMSEMLNRGYSFSLNWADEYYRGVKCEKYKDMVNTLLFPYTVPIYPEHNEAYLIKCLENLKSKGVDLYAQMDNHKILPLALLPQLKEARSAEKGTLAS